MTSILWKPGQGGPFKSPVLSSPRGALHYVVDNLGDRVIEALNAGLDHVRASVAFSLAGQHIENLTLTSKNAISGTGNSLANRIMATARVTG